MVTYPKPIDVCAFIDSMLNRTAFTPLEGNPLVPSTLRVSGAAVPLSEPIFPNPFRVSNIVDVTMAVSPTVLEE